MFHLFPKVFKSTFNVTVLETLELSLSSSLIITFFPSFIIVSCPVSFPSRFTTLCGKSEERYMNTSLFLSVKQKVKRKKDIRQRDNSDDSNPQNSLHFHTHRHSNFGVEKKREHLLFRQHRLTDVRVRGLLGKEKRQESIITEQKRPKLSLPLLSTDAENYRLHHSPRHEHFALPIVKRHSKQ